MRKERKAKNNFAIKNVISNLLKNYHLISKTHIEEFVKMENQNGFIQ